MRPQRILIAISISVIACCATADIANGSLVYSNDFDGPAQTGTGISTTISGGTATGGGIAGGTTSSQGFAAYSDFGGDFWRITAPDDVLEFNITGVPTAPGNLSVCFSLGMMDSWDGTSGIYGTDVLNIAILDGATQIAGISEAYSSANAPSAGVDSIIVQDVQLGFNSGILYWNEDGYRMCFDNLTVASGNLKFQVWGSSAGTGSGFQGGDDESFAIDNLLISIDDAAPVPEPTALAYLLLAVGMGTFPRRRRAFDLQ